MTPPPADAQTSGPGVIQTLVLSDSPEMLQLLAAQLRQADDIHVSVAQMAFGEGMKALSRHEPHVVLIADTYDSPPAVVEMLDGASPGTPLLAILPEGDQSGAQACVLAGARATLLKPIDHADLIAAVRQVHVKETRRRQHVMASLEAGAARPQRPRIVAVHGGKGGVGATTIACNLAASLRQLTGRRVGLVDADVLGGDLGVLMDLPTGRSVADLLPVLRDLEADLVNRLFSSHPTGVRVLFAPEELQRAEAISGDEVQRVLSSLKPYFDYQIVDTASSITPVTLATLDEADAIVYVVTPELPALRSAARFLQLAAQLGYPSDKLLLVANRANAGKGVTPALIEEQLQRPLAATIPSDGRTLVASATAGELLVTARPRHKVSRAIESLAHRIAVSYGWDPGAAPERVATESTSAHAPWWVIPPLRRPSAVPAARLATSERGA